jgi:hypothetical protein
MEANYMTRRNINSTKREIRIVILAIACLLVVSLIAIAHGGLQHVIGTVVKVSDASVSVKTPAGKTVEVGFDDKTIYSRAKSPIEKGSIKPGDRIVIHAAEIKEKLVARTVEIGVADGTTK